MGNCFRCYFRQLFISLALRKCKRDCKIPKIILVPGLCPLKTEIVLDVLSDFVLKQTRRSQRQLSKSLYGGQFTFYHLS